MTDDDPEPTRKGVDMTTPNYDKALPCNGEHWWQPVPGEAAYYGCMFCDHYGLKDLRTGEIRVLKDMGAGLAGRAATWARWNANRSYALDAEIRERNLKLRRIHSFSDSVYRTWDW